MEEFEKGTTRRHTFFCINKARHAADERVVEAVPKEVAVFGHTVQGWLITTEEPVIDKTIPLGESLQGDVVQHDPE
ncbi:MAG: hypothetical protein AB1505_10075 [Candidatus Latescibacterota bacterium]